MMTITTKLTQQDFVNVTFILWSKKFAIKFLIAIYSFVTLMAIISIFASGSMSLANLLPIAFFGFVPMLIFFTAKSSYKNNPRISEPIEYKFEKDFLIVTGESFNSQLTWDKIYKVTKTKNWLLIWQSSQLANAIPNRDLWPSHIDDLKEILAAYNVKNNL